VSQKLLDLPVSQLRAIPDDRALKLCCLRCCPAHIRWASSETLAWAEACQTKLFQIDHFTFNSAGFFMDKAQLQK